MCSMHRQTARNLANALERAFSESGPQAEFLLGLDNEGQVTPETADKADLVKEINRALGNSLPIGDPFLWSSLVVSKGGFNHPNGCGAREGCVPKSLVALLGSFQGGSLRYRRPAEEVIDSTSTGWWVGADASRPWVQARLVGTCYSVAAVLFPIRRFGGAPVLNSLGFRLPPVAAGAPACAPGGQASSADVGSTPGGGAGF